MIAIPWNRRFYLNIMFVRCSCLHHPNEFMCVRLSGKIFLFPFGSGRRTKYEIIKIISRDREWDPEKGKKLHERFQISPAHAKMRAILTEDG